MGNVIVRRLTRLLNISRSTNRSWSKVRLIANKDQWNTCVLSYSWYQLGFMCLWARWDSAHTRIVRVSAVGMKTTALAGPIYRFCVISAGETGKSCRELPGARPACSGTPETPADNTGCSLRARTEVVILYTDMGVRFGREPKWLDSGCLWGVRCRARTEFVCAEEGVRFGWEPKCVRRKTVIPWTIIYV